MTPVSFAKLIIRLGIAAIAFAELPQIELLPVSIGIALQQPGQRTYFYALMACLAIQAVVMVVAWFGAGRLARFVAPGVNTKLSQNVEASQDYGQWQHAGFMLIGGCMVLRAVATPYAPCWFCNPEPRTLVHLTLGVTLIIGWDTLIGVFRRGLGLIWRR